MVLVASAGASGRHSLPAPTGYGRPASWSGERGRAACASTEMSTRAFARWPPSLRSRLAMLAEAASQQCPAACFGERAHRCQRCRGRLRPATSFSRAAGLPGQNGPPSFPCGFPARQRRGAARGSNERCCGQDRGQGTAGNQPSIHSSLAVLRYRCAQSMQQYLAKLMQDRGRQLAKPLNPAARKEGGTMTRAGRRRIFRDLILAIVIAVGVVLAAETLMLVWRWF
jgi:hypothetical protein